MTHTHGEGCIYTFPDCDPEPSCCTCGDRGWLHLTPCPDCNARGQNGSPYPLPIHGPLNPDQVPF